MQNNEDMTELREATIAMHELYLELKSAGFSVKEALILVAQMMAMGANDGKAEGN